MPESLPAEVVAKRDQLLSLISALPSCAVAFSAGVDSAVVAKAAALALGDRAVAVTGVSASLAQGELEEARAMAALIGIRHVEIETHELTQEAYAQNAPDRCYHCKTELYLQMQAILPRLQVEVVLNGANADDLHDYRPGTQAAVQQQVRSPLSECQLSKAQVRQLAQHWGLPIWNKPATPCLSSRLAYGEQVTPERLEMVDQAERYLRQLGLETCRVRYHRGDLARIEVPVERLAQLQGAARAGLVEHLLGLGFKFVTLDLQGFRSGSLNVLVPLEQLQGGQP